MLDRSVLELQLANVLSDAAGLAVDLRDLAEAPLELRGRVLEDILARSLNPGVP